jgi:hypothetical protein
LQVDREGNSLAMAGTKARLRYHCVSIVGGPNCCPAVKEMALLRLLSAEAPRLPIKTCDRPETCNCKFRHYDDRRAGPRRATEGARVSATQVGDDRRRRRGRRDADYEEF